jgi:hypothetical protein
MAPRAFTLSEDASVSDGGVDLRMYVFDTPQELDVLRRPGFVRGRAVLVLRFPGIAPNQLRRWQRILNARYNACGCATGAAFAFATLLGVILWQWWLGGWAIAHWGAFGLRALTGSVLAVALGKAIGTQLARWDLRRVAQSIQKAMSPAEAGEL